ncbi:olfactory receptor 52N4-like [Rhinatrema bivittatum]|uniref:olfactory receptor 52N4-like n=1 Tax=Rhinatrema bivittatum TaxID=194408 RepID=UPI00112DC0A6|nr:olfactory receptor 52N4-like [Rhinatrema bivittatum]
MFSNRRTLSLGKTELIPSFFVLKGIPGLEDVHIWISIPFSLMYVITVIANCLILFIIKTEARLHQPMYVLLSVLAGIDLALSTSSLPKAIGIFWFKLEEIRFDVCLLQMFLIQYLGSIESGILTLMALDRYIAVCNPLRYTAILTNTLLAKMVVIVLMRSAVLVSPVPILLKRLPFCNSNVIHHTYCEHMSVAKLACADITVNFVYGLSVSLFIGGIDVPLIALSYALILRSVMNLSSKDTRAKAFSTCTAHVCVIAVFYTPFLFSVFIQRFKNKVAPSVQITVANIYLLVPPMVNPIIYGVKTKQIQERILKMVCRGKVTSDQKN